MISFRTIYSPHLTGEEADVWRGSVTCPLWPEVGSLPRPHFPLSPVLPLPRARLEALKLRWVPDDISVTRKEDIRGPCGQPQAGSPSPHHHCGHGAEAVSEGSTWDREGWNAVTHAPCRAAHSCSEGTPARVRQLPSSLCQSLLA